MLARIGLTLAASVAVLVCQAARAEACTCQSPGNHVLLPSATKWAPVGGPWLVVHGEEVTPRLLDDQGQEWLVESARRYDALGLCPRSFELLRPTAPIPDGMRYSLELVSPGGAELWDKRTFIATSDVPRMVKRELSVKLERMEAPGVVTDGGCSSPELIGETQKGVFAASVSANAATLLFLEVSAEDTKHGTLTDGNASVGPGSSSEYALIDTVTASVPELTTTASCAHVVVRDALDATVYDQTLCPDAGASVEETLSVTLPEHLIREAPKTEPSDCSVASPGAAERRLGAWFFVLALAGLARRLRVGGPALPLRSS